MKKQLFDDLVASVREAGRIHRGEAKPSRSFVFKPEDVRHIREKLHKSQSEFADDRGERRHAPELGAGAARTERPGAGAAGRRVESPGRRR